MKGNRTYQDQVVKEEPDIEEEDIFKYAEEHGIPATVESEPAEEKFQETKENINISSLSAKELRKELRKQVVYRKELNSKIKEMRLQQKEIAKLTKEIREKINMVKKRRIV